MEALAHAAEHLAQPGRLGCRSAERMQGTSLVKAQQPGAGCGRADHADRAGNVPADFVVRGHDRLCDAAFHFDTRHKSIDQFGAGRASQFGERQQRCGDGPAGVDQYIRMGIVEVQHV